MQQKKVTIRQVRIKAARHGFLTIAELAERVGCSRQSIYFAIERPTRYSRVFEKLMEVLS